MSLKEKCGGSIKRHTYAYGRNYYKGLQKKEATSQTMALESVLFASEIGEHERRDVAVVNIPGEFLTTKMDQEVIMVLPRWQITIVIPFLTG